MVINRRSTNERPKLVATGLISLDIVIDERNFGQRKMWTGGTCGNVLAILSYLGWEAWPLARLGNDTASRIVRRDLAKWNVKLDFISLERAGEAPTVVHRLRRTSKGINYHSFSLNCPGCGRRLPSYRPVTVNVAQSMERQLPKYQVFFADRASAGTVELARQARGRGSLIVFEPSSFSNENSFAQMLALTDILKYSEERLPVFEYHCPNLLIEIQTKGANGLRYRTRVGEAGFYWRKLPAFKLAEVRDSAGAGDWCTAGLIHRLAHCGRVGLLKSKLEHVTDALIFSQALAAWNCGFEGARGGMYVRDKEEALVDVQNILTTRPYTSLNPPMQYRSNYSLTGICASCRTSSNASALA